MRPAILYGRVQRGCARQQQRTAPHAVTGIFADLSAYAYGAGQHARGAVIAGVAFDQQQAASHLVTDAVTGAAGDDHGAAFHALALADNGCGKKVAGIAVDDAKLGETKRVGLGPGRYCELPAHQYVADYVLPNLYFHVTAAYAILRVMGAPIGKSDYMRFLAPHVKHEKVG